MNIETDPHVLFFISIAEKYYSENFNNLQFEEFRHEFIRLLEENNDELIDNLRKNHILNPLFVMAIYHSIKGEVNDDMDLLKIHIIDGLYGKIMDEYLKSQKSRYEKSLDPWQEYLEDVKKGNKMLYDNELFDLEITKDEENDYRFHLNRCYYWDVFRQYEMDKLGPIMCEYDFLLSQNVEKWIVFTRKNTLDEGGLFCDFNLIPNHKAVDSS
jgi:hypothetical protein